MYNLAEHLSRVESVEVVQALYKDTPWRALGRADQTPPNAQRTQVRPRSCWRDYISQSTGECLGIHQDELGIEKSGLNFSGCCCCDPNQKTKWMNDWVVFVVKSLICYLTLHNEYYDHDSIFWSLSKDPSEGADMMAAQFGSRHRFYSYPQVLMEFQV